MHIKSLLRRKSTPQAPVQETSPTTSSFRVIPRRQGNEQPDKSNRPLANLQHRQTWEDDSSSSNRASGSTASTNHQSYNANDMKGLHPSYGHQRTHTYDNQQRGGQVQAPNASDRSSDFLAMPEAMESNESFGGGMFDSIGNKSNNELKQPARVALRPDSDSYEPPARYSRVSHTPPPLHARQSKEWNPSPYSMRSRNSQDGLLSSPQLDQSPPPPPTHQSPRRTPAIPFMNNVSDGNIPLGKNTESVMVDGHRLDLPPPGILHRSDSQESYTRSGADQISAIGSTPFDADAKMVRKSFMERAAESRQSNRSISPHKKTSQTSDTTNSLHPPNNSNQSSTSTSLKTPSLASSASSLGNADNSTPSASIPTASVAASNNASFHTSHPKPGTPTPNAPGTTSNNTTPRPIRGPPSDSSEDEPLGSKLLNASQANARHSTLNVPSQPYANPQYRKSAPLLSVNNRASTFDNFRQVSNGSTVGGAELAGPSRGQVSPHSRTPSGTPNSPTLSSTGALKTSPTAGRPQANRASQSTPNLMTHDRKVSYESKASSNDEDDEDVPLALLPATNVRIPSNPRAQSSYFPHSSRASVMSGATGPSNQQRGSVLPPFARRLPQDPYGSPQEVMNASRESLVLQRPQSIFPPGSPVPGLPAGGLVGIIQSEEHAKGMRRAVATGQSRSMTMGGNMNPAMSMGMGGMPMPAYQGLGQMGMGGGGMDPAMMQMAMQMQMQAQAQQAELLAQMQQQNAVLTQLLMQNPQHQQMMMEQGLMSPDMGRPMSMASQGRSQSMMNLARPNATPRTMSMISPPFTGQPWPQSSGASIRGGMVGGMGPGYAPSVAPSERSNVGLPGRYKAVSTIGDTQSVMGMGMNQRASTMMSSLPPQLPLFDTEVPAKKKGFLSVGMRTRGSRAASPADVEEEEDWSAFRRRRN
ncbi:hypothetical protein BT63DRAFT_217289 [Microthyrium microscopicum]|uniref:Uncharacterized protein n=1 Tax=Microthyrium microscopicum TaxID=703497 RepID=A0A6A6UJ07_9PEZI|nr:hypothetical protein BT63DRAFT_217289 [Microthyrium microscopicum]